MLMRLFAVALSFCPALIALAAPPAAPAPAGEAPTEAPKADVTQTVSRAATELASDPLGAAGKWSDRLLDWLLAHGPSVLVGAALLIVGWVLSSVARRVIIRGMTKAHIDLTLAKFVGNVARWAILIFAVLTSAGTVGIETTGFAALIAASGLAIGLALQGNLGNLAAGVLLMIFRPFKIGDAVVVAGQAGIVDGIDLFTTNLDTGDNRRIIVPNNAIFGGVIENQTRHPTRRVIVNVPVFAGADVERTRDVLAGVARRVASSTPGALAEPAPGVALAEIAPGVVWSVGVSCRTQDYLGVREALLVALKAALGAPEFAPPAPVQHVFIKEAPRAVQSVGTPA